MTTASYDLTSITKVHEVEAWGGEEADVNDYLKAGGILLATYLSGDVQMGQSVIFVAGWRRELGEANHPKIWA